MSLSQHRVLLRGESPFPWEREAIDFLEQEIPNGPPFAVWELVELLDASTGRLYEIDALVLGYSALYVVEMKSGPGLYKGDGSDWYRHVPGEPPHYMECPYRLTNTKAKVLGGLLQRKLNRAPWVQPLIFLSHADARFDLRADGVTGVVNRAGLKRAITHHEFPNRDQNWRGDPIREPMVRDLTRALQEIGVRARKGRMHAGSYELRDILEDGTAYQDREAVHRTTPTIHRRARTYLVPQQTSVERRQALRRAADREAQLLHELRDHAGILRLSDYIEDAPLGPTVLFDPFDGVRLDVFIRQNPSLSLGERVEIVKQVGNALAFCHRKEIWHGGLNPESALVRRGPDGSLDVRIFNFQLASATDRVEPTKHASAWTAQPMLVYQAPELREDPTARTIQSDIFSLGAVAYFILTGQPPATDALAVDERLRTQGALDPRAADDRITADLAEVVKQATSVSWASRFDDAAEWVRFLEEYATAPDPASKPIYADPLSAKKDDRVSENLRVIDLLGQGASARVLRVRRETDDIEYALKVSLSAEHDERIRAEGRALARFRHARIVERIEELELSGRACLLLTVAGTMTLQRHLQKEGPAPLEYALRWGDDLLDAVEYLEERGDSHRDIKPANLGVGSLGRKANHLTLFDFSLVLSDAKSLDGGTAAYRDPFIGLRGAWDAAADRWSAAVTLHEMLTGVRASYGGGRGSSVDPDAKLVIAAERFDAAIRDRLVRFFEKALARSIADRFESAPAMRRAWTACFAEPSTHQAGTNTVESRDAGPEQQSPEPPPVALTDDDVRRIPPEAPIDTLPLSVRAKNALDRAGIIRARDLAKLPSNRISAIRGVGSRVVNEIHDFRIRWTALHADSDLDITPFFAGYRGESVALARSSMSANAITGLGSAGLNDYAAVAGASDERIQRLSELHGFDARALHEMLDREHRVAEERDHPVTLEGWKDALLAKKKRGKRAATPPAVRVLLSLEPAAEASSPLWIGVSLTEAAAATGTTKQNVSFQLSRAREVWAAHPAIAELVGTTHALVEAAGGAIPIIDAADRLLQGMPHDRNRPTAELTVDAAAILRVAVEVDRASETPGTTLARFDNALWICATNAHVAALRALATVADELALRTPLASAPETQDALRASVEGTPLASLPIDRLTVLAARASQAAACSTRFEMYPRQMDPSRAIELTASVLTGKVLMPDDVRQRVRDRYPEAAPLPEGDALNALLKPHGLDWVDDRYVRRGEESRSRFSSTLHTSLAYHSTALPEQSRDASPEALASADLDARLVVTIEKKQLRVVLVRADLMSRAIPRLAARFQVPVQRVDRLLLAEMNRVGRESDIDLSVLHDAHEAGEGTVDWNHLVELARDACRALVAKLLPARAPLLLSHLGLVQRYALDELLGGLAESSRRDDCEGILLIVPSHDESSAAALDGLQVPGLLPSQILRLSRDWIENRHNAAAPAA